MGLLERLLHPRRARERRHAEGQRAALRRELREYALLLDTIERRPAVTADTSLTVEQRAAEALGEVRAQHARFQAACARAPGARDALRRRLAEPGLAPAVRDELAPEFARLAAAHPNDASIAALDARWRERLSQLEHWASPRDRRPQGALQSDHQDHLHRGWWDGS